jgi:hypothetical protein
MTADGMDAYLLAKLNARSPMKYRTDECTAMRV